jgi:HK97 family phage portal protein
MLSLTNAASWLSDLIFGESSDKYVTPDSAIKYPPIWYAVSKISGHVGQLPLVLHRRLPDGRGVEVATNHPAYRLLKVAPNSWQTPVVFKQTMQAHALLWGNAYAYIATKNGRPSELIPLYPGRTAPDVQEGVKLYIHLPHNSDDPILQHETASQSSQYLTLRDDQVIHIPGLGFDGYAGKSLWKVASDSWDIGLQSDRRIQFGFKKGFKAAMLLEAPPEAFKKPEDAKEFIDDFNAYHSGSENADKAGLLTRGIKANVTQMNSQESQMVEHRRYQRQDAALWFLLESILGDDSSVSYNSLEQKNLAYLSNCLMPWLVKWEEECNRKLLSTQSNLYYTKFNTAALLRADYKTTIESLGIAITQRIMSPNEARQKLDMNPYDGGDEYANPAITPGQGGQNQDVEEPELDEEESPQDRVIRERVAHMIGVESKRVVMYATADNFCNAIDEFYARWVNTFGEVIQKAGVPRELADEYCEQSRQMLLACADQATTTEELKKRVSDCVCNWKDRAGELLCQII